MYSIVLKDGNIINIKTDQVEWGEGARWQDSSIMGI